MTESAYPALDPVSDLKRHATTYHRFMLGVKWTAIHFAAIITFLTMWFASSAGFFGGLAAGVVVLAVGIYAMANGLGHSSESDNPT